MTFSPDVYAQIREGAQRSAAVVVPLVCSLFEPKVVVDVGCGEGWFARAFLAQGCRVLALDESVRSPRIEWAESGRAEDGAIVFQHADLTGEDWRWMDGIRDEPADLAVCLEVAEHLPPSAADLFVDGLCAVAPLVVFSAAVPGQGGHAHLNEQWPAYWVERFERHGFEVSGALRWNLWGNDEVEPWYQQNLMVAVHRERAGASLSDYAMGHGMDEVFGEHAFTEPVAVVHPTTFSHHVALRRAGR